jgi:hypothetical protein
MTTMDLEAKLCIVNMPSKYNRKNLPALKDFGYLRKRVCMVPNNNI